jgi:predicted ferric reductase
MNLFLRGIIWFGVYVMLVALPATVAIDTDPFGAPRPVAVELGVALGLLAFPLLTIQFALVSRLRASSAPFGTDAMVQFHRYVGMLCLLFVIGHAVLLMGLGASRSPWNAFSGRLATLTGVVAAAAMVVMTVTTVLRKQLRMSYEQWQWLHVAMAIVAVGATLIHVLEIGGYSRVAAMRYLFVLYAAAFGSLMLDYRLLRPWRMRRRPWEVVANRDDGASTRTLSVRPIGHHGFRFEPGQFAWFVTGTTPWSSQQHPLSISSSAEPSADQGIEFSIKGLGDWSSAFVPQLRPGTRVWVDGPFGAFTIDRKRAQGFVLIAGGIGIAPLRSMLLTMRDRGDRRHVVLFYAAHDEKRIVFRQQLEALRPSMALDVVYVFEKPAANWSGERGMITPGVLQRHLPVQFQRYAFFICGPSPMMDAVETMLLTLGVSSGSIETERFYAV